MTDEERIIRMYEINNGYLEDARIDLNIQMKQPIIAFGDLGLLVRAARGIYDDRKRKYPGLPVFRL